jgi:hypothetical protein
MSKTNSRRTIDGFFIIVPTNDAIDDVPKNPSSLEARLKSWIIG